MPPSVNQTRSAADLAKMAFGGVGSAKASRDANYIRPVVGLFRIDKMKLDFNRKNELFFANEMTAIKIMDPCHEEQLEGQRGHRVGEAVTHMLMKKQDPFLPNIKAMVGALLDIDPDSVNEEHCSALVTDDQPMSNMVVEIKARNITTKNDKDFTRVTYIREVPPDEVKRVLLAEPDGENLINRFFPNGLLDRLIEATAAQGQKTAA